MLHILFLMRVTAVFPRLENFLHRVSVGLFFMLL